MSAVKLPFKFVRDKAFRPGMRLAARVVNPAGDDEESAEGTPAHLRGRTGLVIPGVHRPLGHGRGGRK